MSAPSPSLIGATPTSPAHPPANTRPMGGARLMLMTLITVSFGATVLRAADPTSRCHKTSADNSKELVGVDNEIFE